MEEQDNPDPYCRTRERVKGNYDFKRNIYRYTSLLIRDKKFL